MSDHKVPAHVGSLTYGDLPAAGVIFSPGVGWLRHQQRTWRGGWMVVAREIADPENVKEIAFARRATGAARRFQRARREDIEDGWVVEALRAVIGGWQLVDRAPWLRFTNVLDDDPDKELVWGANGEVIGLTWPGRPGTWHLMIRDPKKDVDGAEAFSLPSSISAGLHRTRLKAIETATAQAPHSAVPADDHWAQVWSESVQRFRAANISSTFVVNVLFLGPTGVGCTAPGCDKEAFARVSRAGTDVGVDAHMACFGHAGEAVARQTL